jgi:hypothetical protein
MESFDAKKKQLLKLALLPNLEVRNGFSSILFEDNLKSLDYPMLVTRPTTKVRKQRFIICGIIFQTIEQSVGPN